MKKNFSFLRKYQYEPQLQRKFNNRFTGRLFIDFVMYFLKQILESSVYDNENKHISEIIYDMLLESFSRQR